MKLKRGRWQDRGKEMMLLSQLARLGHGNAAVVLSVVLPRQLPSETEMSRSLHAPSTGRTQHLIAVESNEEREWKKRDTGQSPEAQAEPHRRENWHVSEQMADRHC